jgi:sortase B
MLRYRNIWDGTEIAKAWGYNAEIGTEYMPRVRAEGLDKMPITGFSYVTADYAPYTELVDGKLLVTYWYRQTVSGDWPKVRTGDDGRARLTAKDRETYGLLSDAELYSRLLEAKAANPDVIGYLSIPGTDLHEPVVQTTDNVTYLTHGPSGAPDSRGAVFADYRSPRYVGDSSRTTLLHSHNMRDGSMFGVLASYGDADFWAAHPFIQYVDAVGNGGTWLVYSARVADGSDDAFAFPVMRPYSDRIARWADRSFLDPGFRPDPAGRTLTLSTCAYHVEDGKLLVHAELIEG